MARYIDADALIAEIKRIYCTDCNNYNEVRCRACGTDDALRMIEDAPEADVVPKSEVEYWQDAAANARRETAREILAELIAEITADRDRAYDNIEERNLREESRLNDAVCIHEDGKLIALNGMLYSVHELKKKYTEEKE